MCERLTITIQCYQLISIPFIMHHRHGCVLKVLHWVSSSQSWEDELTIMMYVHVHYIICTAVDKASSPPSSCRSFAPQTQVSPYKPFPGLSDNDLTPTLLVSSLMTLKINPLQSCPAHVIVVKMISNYPKKLRKKKTWGTLNLLIFTSHKPEIPDQACMLQSKVSVWHNWRENNNRVWLRVSVTAQCAPVGAELWNRENNAVQKTEI